MACLTYGSKLPVPTFSTTVTDELECLGLDTANPSTEVSTSQWISRWTAPATNKPICVDVFKRILNGEGTSSSIGYSAASLDRLQKDFDYMLSKYFSAGNKVAVPGQTGYTAFMDNLFDACRQIPGACMLAQTRMCSSCTRADISSNSRMLSLCGCVSPDLNQIYKTSGYGVSFTPECDPLCTQSSAFKLINSTTGAQKQCQSTVCVIDNVSIAAAQSTVSGGVQFNQVCPACSLAGNSNPCVCIINVSVDGIMERVGGTGSLSDATVLNQYCPNARCLSVNPMTGEVTTVPCQNTVTSAPLPTYKAEIGKTTWIALAVILVVAVIAVLAYWFSGKTLTIYTLDGETAATRPPDASKPIPQPKGTTSLAFREGRNEIGVNSVKDTME